MVNYKDKERIIFFRNIAFCIQKYESSNDEINRLIYEFYCKCFRINYDKNDYHKLVLNNKTCDDFFVNNRKIIHQISECDLILSTAFKILYEYDIGCFNDDLTDIISKIYWKFDELIYPKFNNENRDIKDIKYVVEITFEEKNDIK